MLSVRREVLFAWGYYHQRNDFHRRRTKPTRRAPIFQRPGIRLMTAITRRNDFVFLLRIRERQSQRRSRMRQPAPPRRNQGLVTALPEAQDPQLRRVRQGGRTGLRHLRAEGSALNDKNAKPTATAPTIRRSRERIQAQSEGRRRGGAPARFHVQELLRRACVAAVMSTGVNCGQVRGPVQLSFATCVSRSFRWKSPSPAWRPPTRPKGKARRGFRRRSAQGKPHDGPQAHRALWPLVAHGFVSANLAARTGFGESDIAFLWDALANMFEHDRSAARGEMTTRKLVVFEHTTRSAARARTICSSASISSAAPATKSAPSATSVSQCAARPPFRRLSGDDRSGAAPTA